MRSIRVLVVEDSLTVRRRLVEVLRADAEIEVVAEAEDGKTGIELCRSLRPDVVTLDMMLPLMSGLAATEYIMAYCPTPILIVSSSTNRRDLFKTYDALAAGALEVLEKPRGNGTNDSWEETFLSTVKLVSRIKVITHVRARLNGGAVRELRRPVAPSGRAGTDAVRAQGYRVVAIGTSTGGPAAAAEILRALPRDFPLPVLLVIHIGASFSQFLAEWLDGQSLLPVSCVRDGDPLPPVGQGRVLLAPPDRHLIVCKARLRLSLEEERHSCRPSVNVLFESLAQEMASRTIACLLTGMGKDGAQGLLAVRRGGGRTMAQDEASCAVFGMPAEAIRIGGAERVIGLAEFAPMLIELAPAKERSGA